MNDPSAGSMLPGIMGGMLGLAIMLFLLVLAVLWFCLPFAVFGIKERLDKLNAQLEALNKSTNIAGYEQRKTNMILQQAHNVTVDET